MRRGRLWVGVVATALVALSGTAAQASPVRGTTTSDAVPASVTAAAVPGLPGGYHPAPQERVLDTRDGTGAVKGLRADRSTTTVTVTGIGDVPTTGVGAVAISIIATGPTGTGYVTAYPHGEAPPTASTLNWTSGRTISNLTLVKVGADGRIDLGVNGYSTHLVADLVGWVEAPSGTPAAGTVTPLSPARILDTRHGNGAPTSRVAGGTVLPLAVAGHGGVPAGGAGSVVVNLTATGGTAGGFVSVTPTDPGSATTTSTLNWAAGDTVANLVTVALGPDGGIDLRVVSSGSVHLVADVLGYVTGTSSGQPWTLEMRAPARVLDTRLAAAPSAATAGTPTYFAIPPEYGWRSGVGAAVLNVTMTNASYTGYATVVRGSGGRPPGSTLNFEKGRAKASQVIVPLTDSLVAVDVSAGGTVDVVVDLVGLVLAPAADDLAPPQVAGLAATVGDSMSVALSWTHSAAPDLRSVVVRRAVTTVPKTPADGVPVPLATPDGTEEHVLSPSTRYHYVVFVVDHWWNLTGRQVDATTSGIPWQAPVTVAPAQSALLSMSCPTTDSCLAGDVAGRAYRFTAGTWSAPVQVLPRRLEVDCVGTSWCLGVDARDGRWRVLKGTTWSAPATMPPGLVGPPVCTDTTFCLGFDTRGRALRFTGSGWTTATPVFSTYGGAPFSFDCTSRTACLASDGTRWSRWNGSSWTSPRAALSDIGVVREIQTLSCVSATWCMLVDSQGITHRYDGTRVTQVEQEWWNGGPLAGLWSLDCTSRTFCLAAGGHAGSSAVWNGESWSTPVSDGLVSPQTDEEGVISVECLSLARCVVSGQTQVVRS